MAAMRHVQLHPASDPMQAIAATCLATLLLRHADSPSAPSSRLGVLATHTQGPVMSQTAMRADLLQALEVITEFRVNTVGKDLGILAVDNVALSVQEPAGDLRETICQQQVHRGPDFAAKGRTLYCVGFWMMLTMRSSSSEVSSPARLVKSMSAFLL
jgi:hypothetical protein